MPNHLKLRLPRLTARLTCVSLVAVGAAASSLQASTAIPQHVVVVMLEDRGANAIGDTANMPYLNHLASTGLVYTNSHGLNDVSQDGQMNYLALYSGSTQGVTTDAYAGPFAGPNIAQSLNNSGHSFVSYAESLPYAGDASDAFAASPTNPAYDDFYTRAYNPAAQFSNAGTGKSNADVNQPFTNFPSSAAGYANLPTVSLVIPNTLHNTHGSNDTTPYATDPNQYNYLRSTADSWLKSNLDGYVQWAKQNNSVLLVLNDEGDRAHGFTSLATNDTTMILDGSTNVFTPGTNDANVNPLNVLRTIEDWYGLDPLAGSATASALNLNGSGTTPASVPLPAALPSGIIVLGLIAGTWRLVDRRTA